MNMVRRAPGALRGTSAPGRRGEPPTPRGARPGGEEGGRGTLTAKQGPWDAPCGPPLPSPQDQGQPLLRIPGPGAATRCTRNAPRLQQREPWLQSQGPFWTLGCPSPRPLAPAEGCPAHPQLMLAGAHLPVPPHPEREGPLLTPRLHPNPVPPSITGSLGGPDQPRDQAPTWGRGTLRPSSSSLDDQSLAGPGPGGGDRPLLPAPSPTR